MDKEQNILPNVMREQRIRDDEHDRVSDAAFDDYQAMVAALSEAKRLLEQGHEMEPLQRRPVIETINKALGSGRHLWLKLCNGPAGID